jgi:hypothetical protein
LRPLASLDGNLCKAAEAEHVILLYSNRSKNDPSGKPRRPNHRDSSRCRRLRPQNRPS